MHDFEEKIIAKINDSKADFNNNYELQGTLADATQFDANGVSLTTKVCVVSQTTADVDGTETQILKWVVKNQEAYTAFKAGKKEFLLLYAIRIRAMLRIRYT